MDIYSRPCQGLCIQGSCTTNVISYKSGSKDPRQVTIQGLFFACVVLGIMIASIAGYNLDGYLYQKRKLKKSKECGTSAELPALPGAE
jgi:hypothetical protein